MKTFKDLVFGVALMSISTAILANDVINVNAMNYPAWVLRDYQTIPLFPGSELRENDLVRTGKGGRV